MKKNDKTKIVKSKIIKASYNPLNFSGRQNIYLWFRRLFNSKYSLFDEILEEK
jgi:hypothetical protein